MATFFNSLFILFFLCISTSFVCAQPEMSPTTMIMQPGPFDYVVDCLNCGQACIGSNPNSTCCGGEIELISGDLDFVCASYCLAEGFKCCGCNSPLPGQNADPNALCVSCPVSNKSLMILRSKNIPTRFIKFSGLKYGAPKLMHTPEESRKRPVVLIFGWLGSSEKHLSKYTQLYQNKGIHPHYYFPSDLSLSVKNDVSFFGCELTKFFICYFYDFIAINIGYETIHYIPPMPLLLFPSNIPKMNPQIHQELKDLMEKHNLVHRPFLLHLFSNNGYIHWCYYQKYLQDTIKFDRYNVYYKLQGTIVDSAPCLLNPAVGSRGLIGALFPKIQNHKHWLLTPIIEGMLRWYLKIPSMKKALQDTNSLIAKSVLPFPQWYLFSSSDTMIFGKSIKRHMKRIEKRTGLPTMSFDFMTSDHVAHYRKHPTVYSRKVDSILTTVESQIMAQQKFIAADRRLRQKPKSKQIESPKL